MNREKKAISVGANKLGHSLAVHGWFLVLLQEERPSFSVLLARYLLSYRLSKTRLAWPGVLWERRGTHLLPIMMTCRFLIEV